MNALLTRFKQILTVLEKAQVLLMGVRRRLFDQETLDIAWLQHTLKTPEGIDQLESFISKFFRMQDTFMDKLVPVYLRLHGEVVATATDNLHHMERLGIVEQADAWIDMRILRNRLAHKYMIKNYSSISCRQRHWPGNCVIVLTR